MTNDFIWFLFYQWPELLFFSDFVVYYVLGSGSVLDEFLLQLTEIVSYVESE